ncbi:MAG: hypothetical protein FJ284_15845 [Planctomycetes bacterium]|nr:hypothetical protein [Planctomycetota bacterium]
MRVVRHPDEQQRGLLEAGSLESSHGHVESLEGRAPANVGDDERITADAQSQPQVCPETRGEATRIECFEIAADAARRIR